MGRTSTTTTSRSAADNSHIPIHIRAYDFLIVRANDFLAANDVASSQRVARLLLRSPDLNREHKRTCHRILSHEGSENRVYHTAQVIEMKAYPPGSAKLITIPARSPRTPGSIPRPGIRTTPIKKDDAWIVHSPAKTPTRVTKRVTFADEVESIEDTTFKPSKVGKLFPELLSKFEPVQ